MSKERKSERQRVVVRYIAQQDKGQAINIPRNAAACGVVGPAVALCLSVRAACKLQHSNVLSRCQSD